MHVFLSYPAANQKLADRLRAELSREGLSISAFDARERAGVEWRKQVEPMIRAADDILILVGLRKNPDEAQQLEWRVALQAAWQDPRKRLIPVLVRNATPPPFVFGDYAGDDTKVIRLLDPRDVRGAAEAIRKALQRGSSDVPGLGSEELPGGGGCDPGPKGIKSYPVKGESPSPQQDDSLVGGGSSGSKDPEAMDIELPDIEPPTPDSVEVGTKASYYPAMEEAWQERIQELKEFAEHLKDSQQS